MIKDSAKSCYVTFDLKEDYKSIKLGMFVKCLDIIQDKEGVYSNFILGLVLCSIGY
jgi:hypothetical protein